MIRTVVLVHLNSLDIGGTQLCALDLAEALVPYGYDSHLIGPLPEVGGPSLLDVARERGLMVYPYREPPTVLTHARILAQRADEIGADLVHAYGTWGAPRPIYWGPSIFGRRPWVLTMYEMSLHHSVHRHMPMVVGTEYILEECHDRPGHTVLISPPVDLLNDRPPAEEPSGPGVGIVIVSRLEDNMKSTAVEAAIGAVGILADPDVTLTVVGGGPAEVRLRAMGERVNVRLGRTGVRFTGSMADPRAAYAGADIVLGMGGSAARGLAHGRTLVVQGENGWSELFTPQTAPILARNSFWSPDHVEEADALLAEKLRSVISDPQLRRALGAFGRQFAEQRFGLEAMTRKLAAVYNRAPADYTARSWFADLPVEARRVPAKLGRMVRRAGGTGA
ncbi:MAG: glycosyltransferase family 4 protein [Candidatus Nanopelagicales bacterium]